MTGLPQNAETIFADAIEIESPLERAEYLAQACENNDTLRREVERLVQNHFGAGEFLECPAVQIAAIVGADRRGGVWRRLSGRAGAAGPAARGIEDYQAGHGHSASHRALRG
jgi:hypothetical protein